MDVDGSLWRGLIVFSVDSRWGASPPRPHQGGSAPLVYRNLLVPRARIQNELFLNFGPYFFEYFLINFGSVFRVFRPFFSF